jgi:multimeric flavodoxin WrbA
MGVRMKVVIITGNPRKKGALATLTDEAGRGAEAAGAKVEEVRLADLDIGYCRFCMNCWQDKTSEAAECALRDDMAGVIEKVRGADGLILACQTSGGHPNAVMKTFIERTTWTVGGPNRDILWVKGTPGPRVPDRERRAVIITTAGTVPGWSRVVCNGSTRQMASHAKGIFNAEVVGRLYAGSINYRGLRHVDRRRARKLGARLARELSELERERG